LAHRLAIALLALASTAALLAFCVGGFLGPWLAVLVGALFPISLIALGAARDGRLGRLAVPILILGIVLAVGLALAVFLPEGGPDVFSGVGGLPLGTALMIFVIVPVPLLLTCLAYAFTFDRLGLRPEDLDRVRAAKKEEDR
jgi:hypothetical protein